MSDQHAHGHDTHASGHDASHSDHDHDDHAHGGIKKYITVTVLLIVLTIISFVVGSSTLMVSTPLVGRLIMLAVSCTKALLVMLFFMHLIWEANWKYVLTIPASIMSVFLLVMLIPDVMRRTDKYSEERWLRAAKPRSAAKEHADEGSAHPPATKTNHPAEK